MAQGFSMCGLILCFERASTHCFNECGRKIHFFWHQFCFFNEWKIFGAEHFKKSTLTFETNASNKWKRTQSSIELSRDQCFAANTAVFHGTFRTTNVGFILRSTAIHRSIAIVTCFRHLVIHGRAFRHGHTYSPARARSPIVDRTILNFERSFVTTFEHNLRLYTVFVWIYNILTWWLPKFC